MRFRFSISGACLLAAAVSCGGGGANRPSSALLITLDTTRADALTCYGGPPGVTPHLDALAAEGVRYERARTVAPVTMPSHASMLTGLYPLRHTVHTNSQAALPDAARTLAEDARAAGLDTAAFVAAVVLASDFGLAQGFEHYDQPTRPALQEDIHYDDRPAAEVADAFLSWFDARDAEKPFFAWVHFFDPHLPYQADERFLQQAGGDGYHAEVASMDHEIGRILDALRAKGVYDTTLVIAVADHGEAMGEHGEATHGCLVYDGVIRVPMIVRDAGDERAGSVSDEIVSVADVYPTVADALGLRANADVDGLSLFRRAVPADRGVYFESLYGFYGFGWSQLAGWADERGKYIHSSDPELYDVEADPREERDLVGERADVVEHHRRRLAALADRSVLNRTEEDVAAAALAEQLQNLGYTGAGASGGARLHPLDDSDRPNPRDRIAAHRNYLRSIELQTTGRPAEAVALLEPLVKENPLHHLAWAQLSSGYVSLRRYEDAAFAAQQSLKTGYSWYGPHLNLGLSFDNLGRIPEAIEQYERVVELKPRHLEILDRLVVLLTSEGRADEAARYRAMANEVRG